MQKAIKNSNFLLIVYALKIRFKVFFFIKLFQTFNNLIFRVYHFYKIKIFRVDFVFSLLAVGVISYNTLCVSNISPSLRSGRYISYRPLASQKGDMREYHAPRGARYTDTHRCYSIYINQSLLIINTSARLENNANVYMCNVSTKKTRTV